MFALFQIDIAPQADKTATLGFGGTPATPGPWRDTFFTRQRRRRVILVKFPSQCRRQSLVLDSTNNHYGQSTRSMGRNSVAYFYEATALGRNIIYMNVTRLASLLGLRTRLVYSR